MGNEASKVASGMSKLGAELLPGKGSFILVEGGKINRLQGHFISPEDASEVIQSLRNRYPTDGEAPASGARLNKTITQYHRMQKMDAQAAGAYAPDVLEYAQRPEVIDVFERYYDRDSGEMLHGCQASMVRTIFGQKANRGGWNREKVLGVIEYLRSNPPSV